MLKYDPSAKKGSYLVMLKAGIIATQQFQVTERLTAKRIGSGTVDVLATPVLINWMEQTAWQSVAKELEAGQTTVGTNMEMVHSSATPVGMIVTCRCELRYIDGKVLTFMLTAEDEVGEIARAKHERSIVTEENFMARANSKGSILQ